MIRESLVPIFSLFMALFYFMPWIVGDFGEWSYESSRAVIGLYVLAMIYFLTVWIQIIINIILVVIKRNERTKQRLYLINLIALIIFSVIILGGMSKGMIITV